MATLKEAVNHPKFESLSDEAKKIVLSNFEEYKNLSDEAKNIVFSKIKNKEIQNHFKKLQISKNFKNHKF